MAHREVTFGGVPMTAVVVDDEQERERLWALGDRVFPAYATYRQRAAASAGRTVPLIQLVPRPDGATQRAGGTVEGRSDVPREAG